MYDIDDNLDTSILLIGCFTLPTSDLMLAGTWVPTATQAPTQTRGCDSYTASWCGAKRAADAQDDNLAWLLAEKDEANMSRMISWEGFNQFWVFDGVQRLDTAGGTATNGHLRDSG